MKSVLNLWRSIRRDAPIIGYGPYLTYRYRSYRKNKQTMLVTVAGHKIRVRPGTPDLRVAFQSLRHEFDILSQVLPADFPGLIVDAGGYIGLAALKLAELYPQATVVTIEPSEGNYTLLSQNIADHPRIHLIKAALYAESGRRMPLMDRGTGDWGFSIAVQDTAKAGPTLGEVETVTLEDIKERFPGKPIGLIKLDIEGGEHAIFKDPSSTLHDVPAVFVELHDRIVPGCTEAFLKFSAARWVVNAGGEKLLSLQGKPSELHA